MMLIVTKATKIELLHGKCNRTTVHGKMNVRAHFKDSDSAKSYKKS